MQTQILQSAYGRGSVRDLPRHALPAGSVWKLTDYIPDLLGAPLQKRGGWTNATTALGTEAYIGAVAYAPFSSGDQLVSIGTDLYNGNTDKGACGAPISRPAFFQNLLIIPGSTVKKYDGSAAPSALTGAPAGGLYAAVYKSRLVLAVGDTLHFCAPGDPTTWDALSTVGTTYPITGVAALRNMIAIFSKGHAERLRGSIPPDSTTAGDMVLEPMFDEGCIDARSLVVSGDKVIWANADGVFISDGAAMDNLIALGGLQQYWTTLMSQYTSSWTIAGGLFEGRYIVSIMNGSTFVDSLMCNLATKTWTFLSNVKATMFAEAYASAPELYFGRRDTNLTGAISHIFNPSGSNTADGDGTAVQPVVELPVYRGAPGSKRWHEVWLGVDLNAGGYLTVDYVLTPEGSSYTPVTDDSGATFQITSTTGYQRVRIPVKDAGSGLGLRISQVGASNTTMLFDVEARMRAREGR